MIGISRALVDLSILGLFLGLMIFALIGWGRLLFRFFCVDAPVVTDASSVWLGFATVLGFVEAVHFFIRIDWMVSAAVAVIGFVNLFLSFSAADRKACGRALAFIKTKPVYFISAVVFALISCCRAMDMPGNFDSGLYHFGSIKWLNAHPMIPGLANLHMRFGFNQSYFGFLALSNLAPFWYKGYAAGGLFLLLLTALTIVQVGLTQTRQWRLVFYSVLFIYLGSLTAIIANPAPDTGIDLLEISIFVYLFRLIQSADKKRYALDTIIVLALSAAAIMSKLSSLVFALSCSAIAVIFSIKQGYISGRILLRLIIVLLVMLVVHALRGVLLSGVPLFPNALFAQFWLPWAVAYGVPQYESLLIYSWARTPGVMTPYAVLQSWDWFIPWLHRLSVSTRLSFGLAGLATVLNLWLRNTQKVTNTGTKWLYMPMLLAFAFWFVTAPDPRFLGPLLQLFLALSLWQFLQHYAVTKRTQKFTEVLIESKFSTLVFICVSAVILKLSAVGLMNYSGWAKVPSPPTVTHLTDYGFEVHLPVLNETCWNSALPCAHTFNANLHQVQMTLPLLDKPIPGRYYFSVVPK